MSIIHLLYSCLHYALSNLQPNCDCWSIDQSLCTAIYWSDMCFSLKWCSLWNRRFSWSQLTQFNQMLPWSVYYFIGSTWPRTPSSRPLFLSRGMPIPSDLSDFPSANSSGIGTYVCEISWMCVSRLGNCNISGVECGKIEFLKKPGRI
jgi:hypothetical protein